MKKLICAALILAATAWAQDGKKTSPLGNEVSKPDANVTVKLIPVTRSDVYCAGFMTRQPISRDSFVAGGLNTPYQTRFADRDFVFLKGTSVQPGNLVSIVRQAHNPDPWQLYEGADKLIKEAGEPFFDIGYARVTEIRGDIAVAQVEMACQPIVPGDLIVPFIERPTITARPSSTLDRFPGDQSKLNGKIAMASEFDQFAKTGSKVYLNIGWEKGVKCGDYFRITRTYSPRNTDQADAGEYEDVLVEDTQKNPAKMTMKERVKHLPRRLVGEIIILNVTPTSATGMVTFALEEIHAGDVVELEAPSESGQAVAGSH